MANNAAHDATGDAAHTVTSTTSSEGRPQESIPARVGRYEICGVLGTGAMGVVYRGRDPQLDRPLAIKLVRTDGASRSRGSRLMREAQAMARLRHPNVVPIFDVGLADDAVFVAMPLLEAGTLTSWLRAAPRALDEILDRFIAAGQGLAAAHAAGLVHRDFKPDNVLLGEAGEVQVADFGLARVHGGQAQALDGRPADPASQLGHVVGTPAYMSPEQLRGRPSDARADQFSFCIALWESIFDDRPFGKLGTTEDPLQARLEAIEGGPVPARRERPLWIAQVLARGLAADPDDRWPSMQAMLDAIADHRAPRRRQWRLALALGVLGVAGVAALAWPERSQPAPYHLEPLQHRRDLQHAAISPDGTRFAFVQGDALAIRDAERDNEERVIIEHGISDSPISWSPDGAYLLVGTESDNALWVETELVDLSGKVRLKLPARGRASFLSKDEVAVTAYRKRAIDIYSLAGANATRIATCQVDDDYAFLWNLLGMPDGTMVAETVKGDSHNLIILQRNCRVRAVVKGEPISSIARSDEGNIIALVAGEGLSEILEISLSGVVMTRRRVSGNVDEVLGRSHGTDYVAALAIRTHLVRVHGSATPEKLTSISGSASFSLSPDGTTVAWVESGTRGRGPLRLSSVETIAQRGKPLLDNALFAGWSPDGQLLAVLLDLDSQDKGTEVVVIDPRGKVLHHLPLVRPDRLAAPVWLSDHRIAAQTEDRTTYRWYDLVSGEQGDVVDRLHGSTYWLARSPRDGMLAMWRNGLPDAHDPAERLWLQPAEGPAVPLKLKAAIQHFLLPSWSPDGALIVRTLDTGAVSRVALDSGELTPIAQLPPTPLRSSFDDHVMTLANGDLLAVEIELGIAVSAVRSADASPRRRAPDPGQ